VFLLDEESLVERLERIADMTAGAIAWDEGAGLRQVSARVEVSTIDALTFVDQLYPDYQEAA